MTVMNKRVILSLLLGCCWLPLQAQQFALKSNALYWTWGTANLGAELALSRHSTFSVTGNYNLRPSDRDYCIQAWFVQPEYRYWLTGKYTRAYVGANLLAGQYDIRGIRLPWIYKRMINSRYTGWAIAAGGSFGYAFYLSPHWNIEVMAGVGAAYVKYRGEPLHGATESSSWRRRRILPVLTEVGVSAVYLFNSRK